MKYPVDSHGRPCHTHFLNRSNRKHLGHTNHEWRMKKRRELGQLERLAWKFLCGSAYTPHSGLKPPPTPLGLMDLIRYMKKELSVNNWGR